MAVDFNGTTSKLENTTAAVGITTLVTVLAWVFADGQGEGGFGRILVLDETGNSLVFNHSNAANVLRVEAAWSGGTQIWTYPATDAAWRGVAITYDAGAVGNDPTARVDFADVTVTQVTATSGTFTQSLAGYCVGNRTAADRTWDGMIQHVQVFNRILTAAEMDQGLSYPGSVTNGLRLWMRMLNDADVNDFSGNGFHGTGTALTSRAPDPPVGLPFARRSTFPENPID